MLPSINVAVLEKNVTPFQPLDFSFTLSCPHVHSLSLSLSLSQLFPPTLDRARTFLVHHGNWQLCPGATLTIGRARITHGEL